MSDRDVWPGFLIGVAAGFGLVLGIGAGLLLAWIIFLLAGPAT